MSKAGGDLRAAASEQRTATTLSSHRSSPLKLGKPHRAGRVPAAAAEAPSPQASRLTEFARRLQGSQPAAASSITKWKHWNLQLTTAVGCPHALPLVVVLGCIGLLTYSVISFISQM